MLSALLLAAPASAQAWSLSGFKVRDGGSRIYYYVSVCTSGSSRVNFTSYLHNDGGVAPTYRHTWRDSQSSGCFRYTLSEQDRYAEGVWDAQLRVVVGGIGKWTPLRYVDIT